MKNKIIGILILLALGGLVISSIQTSHHLRNIATNFETKSFCSVNETINCDLVDASQYSKVMGLPISGLSLLFYASLIVVLLRSLKTPSSLHFAHAMVLVGFIVSMGMAYVSFFLIKLLCLLCIALYAIIILLLLLLPMASGKSFGCVLPFIKDSMKNLFSTHIKSALLGNLAMVALVFLVGIFVIKGSVTNAHAEAAHKAALKAQAQKPKPKFSLEDVLKLHMNQTPLEIDVEGTAAMGNKDAKVTIVEFSDFECPYCKKAADYLKPIVKEYEDDVSFRFVNFPLDKACNPSMTRDMHKNACKAATASICAGKQDKFWPYHDMLFANQPKYSDKDLKDYAGRVGLNTDDFDKCLKSKEALDAVRDDLDRGQKAGVHGTPALFINGKQVQGWNEPVLLKAILDAEIKATN